MRSVFPPAIVDDLEQQLQQSLRKVEPNPDFVTHLHSRLTTPSNLSIEQRQSLGLGMLLIAGSLVSGIFLIWLMNQLKPAPAS